MEEFKIKEKIYNMILYGSPALLQFPRTEKFVLATQIRESMYRMFQLAVVIEKKYYKKTTLLASSITAAAIFSFHDEVFSIVFSSHSEKSLHSYGNTNISLHPISHRKAGGGFAPPAYILRANRGSVKPESKVNQLLPGCRILLHAPFECRPDAGRGKG